MQQSNGPSPKQRTDWIAVAAALVIAGLTGATAGITAAVLVGAAVIIVVYATRDGARRRYEAECVQDPSGAVFLKLVSHHDEALRAADYTCTVTSYDGVWKAEADPAAAMAREATWRRGEMVLHFRQDFPYAASSPPAGRYRVEWARRQVEARGLPVLVTIAIADFNYDEPPTGLMARIRRRG